MLIDKWYRYDHKRLIMIILSLDLCKFYVIGKNEQTDKMHILSDTDDFDDAVAFCEKLLSKEKAIVF